MLNSEKPAEKRKGSKYLYGLIIKNLGDTYYDGCAITHALSKKDAFRLAKELLPQWECDIVVERSLRKLWCDEPQFVKEFKFLGGV